MTREERLRRALISTLLQWRWSVELPAGDGPQAIMELHMSEASCASFAGLVLEALEEMEWDREPDTTATVKFEG